MSDLTESVTLAGLRLVAPLLNAFESGNGMRLFLREMGYGFDPSLIDDAIVASVPGAPVILQEIPDAFTSASLLAAGTGDRNEHIIAIAESVSLIAPAVVELSSYQPAASLAGSPLAEPTFWTGFAADVPDHLFVTYLRTYQPVVHRVARLLGVIVDETRPDLPAPFEGVSGQKEAFRIENVGSLFDDPLGHLRELYGWNQGAEIEHRRLIGELAGLAEVIGLGARRHPAADPFVGSILHADRTDLLDIHQLDVQVARTSGALGRAEALLVVVPKDRGTPGSVVNGLLVTPSVFGTLGTSLPFGTSGWSVDVTAALDAAGVIGVIASPDGFETHVGTVSGHFDTTLVGRFDEPLPIVGGTEGTRIVLRGLDIGVGIAAAGDLEITARAELIEHGGAGLELIIDTGDGDSLLASIVGEDGISVPIDVGITWSSKHGFTVSGSAGLSVTVPLGLRLGPITLDELLLELAVGAGNDGATLDAVVAVSATGELGPVAASIREIGVRLELAVGPSGAIEPKLGFKPPSGLAIAFEASDAISGGGFLDIDHDAGRYSGGASLKIVAVGVSALTVIDTKLPGGGWAFFASLGIDIPGIPIGFGFTLEGVGGIIALNRRIDGEALALGLREGAVDAIMFPDDPVRDAAVLIPQIDAYFPIEVGNVVIGPVVEIGWGAPIALVTAQIGVMISLPQGLIVVMGSVAMALPDPEVPLIEIHMDSLGVIDLAAGTVTVVASLYDSRLLGVIELSGDMAFHVTTSPAPYFALSIGGWHPAFQPPSILPSIFTNLRRIRAEIALTAKIMVSFESYLALTPNTVQFGGKFELVASVKVAFTTYTARGWFEFNVLLVFSPFKLVADVSAGIAVYSGDKELMGISLGARVEGPDPWFASGYASFKFFGVKVKFDFSVGSTARPEVPPITDLLELVDAQIASDSAWTFTRGSGIAAGIHLAPPPESSGAPNEAEIVRVALLADGTMTLRQTAAPLDRELEQYGTNRVAQSRIVVTQVTVVDAASGVALPGAEWSAVHDWFAPAQFDKMSDAQRLAAASYEQLQSGVVIGTERVELGDDVEVPVGHETKLWDPPPVAIVPGIIDIGSLTRLGVVGGAKAVDPWFAPGPTVARRISRPRVVAPTAKVAAIPSEKSSLVRSTS